MDRSSPKIMNRVESVLKFVSTVFCLTSLVITLKNYESNEFGSISYSSLGAFKYLVFVNGVCACYSLVYVIIIAINHCQTSFLRVWIVFLLDQVVTYVVLAAGTASAEVVYLVYKGNKRISWSSVCDSYDMFCHKAFVSVVFTFFVTILYVLLSVISSYRLFSKFEAPIKSESLPNWK